MRHFPVFLDLRGRRVVVSGAGETAVAKLRLLLKTEARITVFGTEPDAQLQVWHRAGRLTLVERPLAAGDADGAVLVYGATADAGADAEAAAIGQAAGALVNIVDDLDGSDFITPAIVDRDPVTVAIGTEGAAPVLARQVKTAVETMLEPRLGEFVALAGRLRAEVATRIAPAGRRAFWAWAFSGAPRQAHARGAEREAARLLKAAVAAGGAEAEAAAAAGIVSLVGAGPGARDLITLRGVQRLQEADVIFYDRLVDPGLLELARRDAERVHVGKAPGLPSWPQDRINGLIVAAARQGKRVVRLKCGDPGIFARGAEEAAACEAAGIAWEIVPGVTAASAAAAEVGGFLTERGRYDSLVLTTGQSRPGDPAPDWASLARPGTTLAVYMGVSTAADLQAALLAGGAPAAAAVEIVSRAGSPDCRRLSTTLGALARTVAEAAVESPSILLVRLPKPAATALAACG